MSTSDPTQQDQPTGPGPVGRRPRRWGRAWVLPAFIVVLLVAVGFGVSIVKAKDYYVIAPGSVAQLTDSLLCHASNNGGRLVLPNGGASPRISVPPARGHAISGPLYMVDVLVGQSSPFSTCSGK